MRIRKNRTSRKAERQGETGVAAAPSTRLWASAAQRQDLLPQLNAAVGAKVIGRSGAGSQGQVNRPHGRSGGGWPGHDCRRLWAPLQQNSMNGIEAMGNLVVPTARLDVRKKKPATEEEEGRKDTVGCCAIIDMSFFHIIYISAPTLAQSSERHSAKMSYKLSMFCARSISLWRNSRRRQARQSVYDPSTQTSATPPSSSPPLPTP